MSTFDHPSDLIQYIPYPPLRRSEAEKGSRNSVLPAQRKKQVPASSDLYKGDDGLFKDVLIASDIKLRPRNTWAVVGSLGFQLLLLAALIIVPLYFTDPLPAKREMVTPLYAPSPAAASSNQTTFRAPASTPTYASSKSSISSPVQKTQEAPATPAGAAGAVIGGVPGGVVGGIPGAVLGDVLGSTRSAPVLAKAPAAMPIKRIRLAPRIVEANLVHDVPPTYPPEAGRARIEGTVVLLAVIGKDGSVQNVRVESGLPILAQAAIDAVKQWRYRPYLLNGEPVEVDSKITINFTLSRS
jgi:periplasmic protein TonB